jgi:hypothetical protein
MNAVGGAGKPTTPNPSADPGLAVEQAYQAQIKRLRLYYESLTAMLRADAPDLLPMLEAPKPLEHGYGIVPSIVTSPQPPQPEHSRSAGYSWSWTHHLIDQQLSKIAEAEQELDCAPARRPSARRSIFEELARSYPRLREGQQQIDAHIEYNRLWQAAIAANRPAYDHQTMLHDLAVERQAIRDALKDGGGPAARRFSPLDKRLKQREEMLERDIEAAIAPIDTPEFVRVERRHAHQWIFVVPIYTDIEDEGFVQLLKSEVEKIWRVRDGVDEFRLEMAVSAVRTNELYSGEPPPRAGVRIEVERHVAHFPRHGAVLTTGGATTHVYGRALILGPHAIPSRVLAHEIGHLLGFKDGYFRGYRDLDGNGFEVLEVVAAPEDIMGAPSTGAVLRRHFDRILDRSAISAARAAAISDGRTARPEHTAPAESTVARHWKTSTRLTEEVRQTSP